MGFNSFDVFPKLDNEFRVGTAVGGLLSLLSLLSVVVLSFVEIHAYMNPPTRQRLIVDTQRPTGADNRTISVESQPRLNISFDILFPSAPCYGIHFDVIDPVTQIPIPYQQSQVSLTRISPDGEIIGVLDPNFLETKPISGCGSCYLQDKQNECCNSCQEVFRAYKSVGFKYPAIYKVNQCLPLIPKLMDMDSEGCHVTATFQTLRVTSSFHIAPGVSWVNEGWHIHDVETYNKTFDMYNLTHKINRLQFTNSRGKLPLDGFSNVQTEKGTWRVVYTADILDNNFSVSRYAMYNIQGSSPGVFVNFDISPITAKMYQTREPLLHLFTRLLTVIGGVLGLFRFIDATLYAAKTKKEPEQIGE